MIEIKTFFNDWYEVNKEQAEAYIKQIMKGMTNLKEADKVKFVEEKRLRGITVEELLYRKQ